MGTTVVSSTAPPPLAGSAGGRPFVPGVRNGTYSIRQGLSEAGAVVVISDAASWTRNSYEELLAGQKVTFISDL